MSLPFFECSSRRFNEIVKPGMLCAFDFDGTLAPIVPEPHRAEVPLPIRRRLIELCEYTPVAIITGRSLADLRARLDFTPDYVVGNHGLEGMPGREGLAARYEQLCLNWERALTAALQDHAVLEPGIWIENKTYSLSVHYRLAHDHSRAEAQLTELFADLAPVPHVIAGKRMFNLLPDAAVNKGTALDQLFDASGAPTALYVGDDATDEDVFRLQRADLLSIRVEPGVDSAAEFFLHHQLDVDQLLDELIARLRHRRSAMQTAPSSITTDPFCRS
jgi:trehalose 6-phosphate phosphatase